MDYNIIQLRNQLAILVDDKEFDKALKLYDKKLRKKMKITDSRGHEFTLLKKDIMLFEKRKTNE